MQNAALYIRVSTEEQTEYSPDAQKRALLEYTKKNDIKVSEENIFIDEGISGRKAEKRPAFMKMIALAKTKPKPFDVILVHRFDRFSRSREDSIVYKSLLRKECDIKVISVTEQMEDDKFSVILEAMLEAMAEYYSLNLADEVVKGMKEKARRGGYQASPPFGYKLPYAGGIPMVIPEEAQIIKLIYEKFVMEKWSAYQIAKYLNLLGIKTRQNNPFERRSVEYILQNPMYKGYVRWNRQHKAANSLREESQWIVEKGQHEAIITEELFKEAASRFQSEAHIPKKARPVTEYKHFLSGLVKCSNCGSTMTASRRKEGKTKYFSCNGYTKGKCTYNNGISERILISSLLASIDKVLITNTLYYENRSSVNLLENELTTQLLFKLEEKEKRIKTAYLNGIDSLEDYKRNKEALQLERNSIKEVLQKANNPDEENSTDEKQTEKHVISIKEILLNADADTISKNKALKEILDKMVYNKQEDNLEIYFHYS